ncbi:putative membrane protein [Leuconostoc inhae]|uniref:Membrane protein n=2 Tax=Leuconostoc TaxID=1243 RepID=A0AAN2UGH9_9LACO|nr:MULTISPECIES: acyltransferase family protein [Leuconostoc]MBZ5956581.1 acyltransferase family protein [Leuconostoc gasicomitatum]MBZ5959459.1 acyltransferase family protein [Leuconostoc gasicomitatum]MBZ5966757.1 acyltransferase family protein [Leuconostoc gasicomitatum]MBZ5979752.1 acyltransferase family protein [Leuconostoc gasicomitatum]MBZ5982321.1 acyltransferase family protein [Leuconostoc gasicomitatum]
MGNRVYQIDVLKVMAIFFVISVHFLLNTGFYDIDMQSFSASLGIVLRLVFITSVPLFIIATGFLMGTKKLSDQYIAKIFRVIILYVLVSMIDWLMQTIIFQNDISMQDALLGLLDFSTDSYSWYVEMYIGLYLLIPLLNAAWNYDLSKQYHIYIIMVSTILFFLPSLFNGLGKILPDWWTNAYPIGYYYVGLYFKTYLEQIKKINTKRLLIWSVSIFSMISFLSLIDNYGRIFSWTDANDYMGYQPFLVAILISLLILKIGQPKKTTKFHNLLILLSNMTLTIYLFSDLTDSLIYHYFNHLVPNIASRFVWAPVVVLLSFTLASLLAYVLEKIMSLIYQRRRA